jgi:uncharacterized protein (TIGR03382 family)
VRGLSQRVLLITGLSLMTLSSSFAADLTIQSTRNAGFDDPTPATPLGLNFGTTRGDQALIVFQAATAMWGAVLRSPIPIFIDSQFNSATTDSHFICTPQGAVLAYTSPSGAETGPNFPNPDAAYISALANALSGQTPSGDVAQFQVNINGDLGTSSCDFLAAWYFGLDTQIAQGTISLFTTLLHEFGHGLGFFSFVDTSSGKANPPTIFDYHIFDVSSGTTWATETPTQRLKLVTTPGGIAFDGPAVRADIPTFLAAPPDFVVTFDAGTTSVNFAQGQFSGPLVGSGPVAATNPLDACNELTDASEINGKFALIERSLADAGVVCTFFSKSQRAADAGAIGVIIYDDVGEALIEMPGTPALSIPAAFISNRDGTILQGELAQGPVSAAFGTAAQVSNTDPSGTRVLLYTPPQVSSGSSVSHWNSNSYPHTLLLEFANEPDIRFDMDFTPDVMSDLGWSVVTGLGVSVVKLLDPEVPAGGQFNYVIAVINRRPTPIDDVTLDLALPSGSTVISNASSPAGCATAFPCNLGPIQAGAVVLVVTTVQAATTAVSPFVATATLTPSSASASDSLSASASNVFLTSSGCSSTGGPATIGLVGLALALLVRKRRHTL